MRRQGMRRLRRWLVLAKVALLGGAVALLVLHRTDLAGAAATQALRRSGFPDAAVTVTELSAERTRAILRLDRDGAVGGTLAILHPLETLLEGRIARLEIVDARLRLDVAKDGSLRLAGHPLAGSAKTGGGEADDATFTLPIDSIQLADAGVTLATPRGTADGTLRLTMTRDGALHRGQATLTAPAKGLPALTHWTGAGTIAETVGTLTAKARLTWDGTALRAQGDLLLADVAGRFGPVSASGVNGVLSFPSVVPPVVAPGQTLAVKLLDIGLPLTDGTLRFGYGAKGRLSVERAEWHWAGGVLRAEPFAIDPVAPRGTVTLRAEGVHLGPMLAMVAVDGLDATGTVSGSLPVRIEADSVHLDGGRLEADAPGTLRYDPENPPGFLNGEEGSPTALLMGALTDFRYDTLSATVDGQAGGELAIGIAIRGSNPAFYDGYPVALNLKVSGALDRILRQSLDTYRIPETVRDRMTEFQRRNP
ncbi:YdbH domain-containing protein [Azospirillum isscasi]|uniref:YdbH domain-containing protein n=1 Tax=Azospirillum isscasi TaxID=3053926 RepID=A0ABU0WCU9_9PROT|nr:YdbH domain-containing protein [Azospirillum isscasi]MDQ2102014.1 YdbH domain-containing protein [Azospirillum isscasi]